MAEKRQESSPPPLDVQKSEAPEVQDELDRQYTLDKGDVIEATDYTQEEYKKIKRKIDLRLMPILFFVDGIQIVDKNALSIQAVFGLQEETNLVGQQYQWLTTIFYLTYLFGQFPSVYLMQRWKLGLSLTGYMFCWGTVLICISACNNFAQLAALRALQGFFECPVKPGFLMITAAWYRTEEHSSRSILWQSSEGLLQIICNLILYGIARTAAERTGIEAWRTAPLFLGSLTLVGAVWSFFTLGAPNEVRWLNHEEKRMAVARVVRNGGGKHDETGSKWNWAHVREAIRDPQLYFSFLNTFLASVPNGGITTFAYLMYETFGFTDYESMLYGLPRLGIYVVVFVIVAWWTERFQQQRLWIMIGCTLLPFVGMLVMSLLPNTPEYKWVKWGMFMCTVVFSLSLFLGWSLMPSNILGKTKYSFVSALTLISYCVGNMIGAQVFRTKDAPRYVAGTIVCSVCFALQALLILSWRLYYMWENKRRDRLMAERGISVEEQLRLAAQLGKEDKTDRENIYKRYTM